MGDIIVYLIESYGGWALVAGLVALLLAEFGLDIVKDLIMDKIRERREKQ